LDNTLLGEFIGHLALHNPRLLALDGHTQPFSLKLGMERGKFQPIW
jgi:hypothetical protein